MILSIFKTLIFAAIFLFQYSAFAEENNKQEQEEASLVEDSDVQKDKIKHQLNVEGSLAVATGNADSENLRGDIDLTSTLKDWKNEFEVEASNRTQNDIREEEYYKIANKLKKDFSQMKYAFGEFTYEDDRFAGIDYRVSEVLGLGYYFIDDKDLKINSDIGIGARQTSFTTNTPDEETFIGTLGLDIFWQINENVEFTEKADVRAGENNTELRSETAIKTFIDKNLYLKFSYQVRHNTEVPIGKNKTDTETIFTVGYKFDDD